MLSLTQTAATHVRGGPSAATDVTKSRVFTLPVGRTAMEGGLATPVHVCERTQYNDVIMVVDRRNEVQCPHTPCRYTSPRL